MISLGLIQALMLVFLVESGAVFQAIPLSNCFASLCLLANPFNSTRMASILQRLMTSPSAFCQSSRRHCSKLRILLLIWSTQSKAWSRNLNIAVDRGSFAELKVRKVILATGSKPKSMYFPVCEIPLEEALQNTILSRSVTSEEVVAVFGSSHSAIMIISNLLNLGVTKVVNFVRSPLIFAEYLPDGGIVYDSIGLKGQTAATWSTGCHHVFPRCNPTRRTSKVSFQVAQKQFTRSGLSQSGFQLLASSPITTPQLAYWQQTCLAVALPIPSWRPTRPGIWSTKWGSGCLCVSSNELYPSGYRCQVNVTRCNYPSLLWFKEVVHFLSDCNHFNQLFFESTGCEEHIIFCTNQ